jgi:hypothetical protein
MRFSSGKAAAAQRGRWRRGAAATATAARARGNEINTAKRQNRFRICQSAVF